MAEKPFVRMAYRMDPDQIYWHVYIAHMHTMENATLIGTILLSVVQDPVVKQKFMDVMKLVMENFLREATGRTDPIIHNVMPAPESEHLKKPD